MNNTKEDQMAVKKCEQQERRKRISWKIFSSWKKFHVKRNKKILLRILPKQTLERKGSLDRTKGRAMPMMRLAHIRGRTRLIMDYETEIFYVLFALVRLLLMTNN